MEVDPQPCSSYPGMRKLSRVRRVRGVISEPSVQQVSIIYKTLICMLMGHGRTEGQLNLECLLMNDDINSFTPAHCRSNSNIATIIESLSLSRIRTTQYIQPPHRRQQL